MDYEGDWVNLNIFIADDFFCCEGDYQTEKILNLNRWEGCLMC